MDYVKILEDYMIAYNNVDMKYYKNKHNIGYDSFLLDRISVKINRGLFKKDINIEFFLFEKLKQTDICINGITVLKIIKGELFWIHSEPKEVVDVINNSANIILEETSILNNTKSIKQSQYEKLCKLLK